MQVKHKMIRTQGKGVPYLFIFPYRLQSANISCPTIKCQNCIWYTTGNAKTRGGVKAIWIYKVLKSDKMLEENIELSILPVVNYRYNRVQSSPKRSELRITYCMSIAGKLHIWGTKSIIQY